MKDNRKWEVYLSSVDTKVLTIGSVFTTIAYVLGFVFYTNNILIGSVISFILAVSILFALLIYFIIGEADLRVSEKRLRYRELDKIIHYCYPSITKDQYKEYIRIAKKNIKKNNRCLMTMKFSDLKEADKWLQMEEHLPLVNKWNYSLSQSNGINIRG